MLTSLAQISGIALPSRYDLLFPLAAGGTASVHLGRLRGIAGFWRLVAVKVAHAHLNEDPQCREMMVDEARLASKIHHPNVVPVIDIDDMDGKLLLVMEYIEGASLSDLLAVSPVLPPRIAIRVALDACAGLHAAHTLSDATGRRLGLVHRDVSPQNILLGTDGVTRLTDFGIAKTAFGKGRSAVGALKGKLAYMAPEYVNGHPADACSDVFGLAVVVWEMLAGKRLFRGENGHETLCNVIHSPAPLLSEVAPAVGEDLSSALAIALAKEPEERFRSARMFGAAIEVAARKANLIATNEEVTSFVIGRVGDRLCERRARIAQIVATEPGSREKPRPLLPDARDEITSRAVPRPRSLPPFAGPEETTQQTPPVAPDGPSEMTGTTEKHHPFEDATPDPVLCLPPASPANTTSRDSIPGAGPDSIPVACLDGAPSLPVDSTPRAVPADGAPVLVVDSTPGAVPVDSTPATPPDSPPPATPAPGPHAPIEETSTLESAAPQRLSPPPATPETAPLLGSNRTLKVVAVTGLVLGGLAKALWFPAPPDLGTRSPDPALTAPSSPAAAVADSTAPNAISASRALAR